MAQIIDTATVTPAFITPPRRLLTDRVLAAKGARRGQLSSLHLENVRDHLRGVADRQQPIDHQRTPAAVMLDFHSDPDGRIAARFIAPQGAGEPHFLTRTAYSQLAAEILPARGGGFLLDLADLKAGAKLASVNFAKFALQRDDVRTFRTIRTSAGPVLRSAHSAGYAAYDNLRFVEDLLTNTEVANLPVLAYHATDSALRLRFALQPMDEIQLLTPTPMIEAWNSETGQRRTGLQAGIWKLICVNGMASWEAGASYGWRHYGDAGRIAQGVGSAVSEIRAYANGTMTQYARAVDTAIDDAAAWLTAMMEGAGIGAKTIVAATEALDDPTTTPGRTLASVIDAVTLIAQNDADLLAAAELERFAGTVLRHGLAAARDGVVAA